MIKDLTCGQTAQAALKGSERGTWKSIRLSSVVWLPMNLDESEREMRKVGEAGKCKLLTCLLTLSLYFSLLVNMGW